MKSRIQEKYNTEFVSKLVEQFSYKNVNEVPRLDKITLSMGIGKAIENNKRIDAAVKDLAIIAGQKPVVTQAKTSVSGFKLREGVAIGAKVTLRGTRMYEFLDRLINLAIPRIRDFRGINPRAFDGQGNYSIGLKEQIVFPEINYDDIEDIRGMDIIVCTTAKTNEEAKALLAHCGFPFRN